MKLTFSVTLFVLILSSLASATLIISPSPLSVDLNVNSQKTFSLNLTNTFNFSIYDISFSNLTGFTFPEISLNASESKTINFNILRASSYHDSISSKVTFNYIVDIPIQVQTYHINITGTGFFPNSLTIRQGDTVSWKNTDDISHTVTSGIFDYTLLPNETTSRVFNELGTRDYNDLIMFFGGSINVINRTTPNKVHNTNYDVNLPVNLNVNINNTFLETGSLDKFYQIDAEGYSEGSLKIKNTGNEIAEKVHLSADSSWIIFSENDFNMNSQAIKYVKYTISPLIFNTSETNRNYTLNMKIKATNTQEYNDTVISFIPYKVISDDITTNEGFVKWYQKFCSQNPQLIICNNTIQENSNNPKVIYKDPEIPINLTATQFYDMLKRLQRIDDSNTRTDNQVKELADMFGLTIPQLQYLLNQSINMQKLNEGINQSRWDAIWIISLCVIIAGAIILISYYVRKRQHKLNMINGT